MKMNRASSFVLLALVYLLASAVGVLVYLWMPGDMWLRLLVADVAATLLTFVYSLLFHNASVYDPYWSVQPMVILSAFILTETVTAGKLLLLVAVCFWGLRLTANWAYTFHGMEHQDWRYTMLKEKTGVFYPIINLVGIHMVPTLVVYGCTLPGVMLMQSSGEFSPLCLIGLAISVLAVFLQGISDIQMHKYRKNRKTPFIEIGLWKHARHPNYLGEILMWWGVAAYTVAALGFQWYYIAGAVANTLLFFFVSIPMADGRQSRKQGFSEYKKRTRMLLPIPKKTRN